MSDGVKAIRYGMFIMPYHDPAKPLGQCYDEDLEPIEEIGPFGTLVLMSDDWDDKPSWFHSMELFARELMPALNRAVCGTASWQRFGERLRHGRR